MTGIFRQKNSANALLLLIYGLVLKFNLFLHPPLPKRVADDHYLYNVLMDFMEKLNLSPGFYSFLAFALIYMQATLFTRICNLHKMFHKSNYLPGMSYLLITSLIPEWNVFSAPLLINALFVWAIHRMMLLYNSNRPGTAIFNIGFIMGVVTLLYQPAIVFVLLIFFALYIMRAFQIREWVVSLLGVTTPYYFLAIILYLTNKFSWKTLLPEISVTVPPMPLPVYTISIVLAVLPFIIGGYFVQNNLSKMLIQVRKNWSLLLIFLIISMLLIVLNRENDYVNWSLSIIPLAGFHAAAYFFPTNRTFPAVMHWIIFGFAIYVNYLHTQYY